MPKRILRPKPLTPYEMATLLLSISGLLSLFFIAQQVSSGNKQARAAEVQTQLLTTQSVMDQMLELDKIFIEHHQVRPYFYDGAQIAENHGEYHRVLAIAEFQLDFFDSFVTQSPNLNLTGEERRNWNTYIGDSFARSPIMCRRLKDAQGWYTVELRKLAKCG